MNTLTMDDLILLILEEKFILIEDIINIITTYILSQNVIDYIINTYEDNEIIISCLCQEQILSIDNINRLYKKDYTHKYILKYQNISINFLESHWNKMDKYAITIIVRYQNLNEKFITKHINDFSDSNIIDILRINDLSLDFILNNRNRIKEIDTNPFLSNMLRPLLYKKYHIELNEKGEYF